MVRYAYQGGRGAGLHKKEVLFLDEQKLISMYCAGDPNAKVLAEETYGESCREIARRILRSRSGADAVFQKVLDQAEKQIPAKNPRSLMFYFWKQTRNLALPQFTAGGEVEYAKAEAAQWMSPRPAQEIDEKQLRRCINEFLYGLPEQARGVFVRRYWYFFTLSEIAAQYGMREDQVQQSLERTGKELKRYLREQELRLPDAMGFLNSFGHIREQWVTEAQRTKAHGAPWVKWVVAGVCACCILALGVWGVSRLFTQDDPAATDPVVSTTAPAEQTPTEPDTEEQTEAPTEASEETEASTEEPTTVPETTEDPQFDPEMVDQVGRVYEKLNPIKNSYGISPHSDWRIAVAKWICQNKDVDSFLQTYDGGWRSEYSIAHSDHIVSVYCYGGSYETEILVTRIDYNETDDSVELVWDGVGYDEDYLRQQFEDRVYHAKGNEKFSDEMKDHFTLTFWASPAISIPLIANDEVQWFFESTDDPCLLRPDNEGAYCTLYAAIPLESDPELYEYTSFYRHPDYNHTEGVKFGASKGISDK